MEFILNDHNMTGTTGKVYCLKCYELKKSCTCKLPSLHIRKPEWIKAERAKEFFG